MQIDTLYIEKAALSREHTMRLLEKISARETKHIDDFQDFFSRRKVPYLQKHKQRNAFIAIKRGAMVKEAPPAYGYGETDLHYYYVHAYNCIYECKYCYLQGYFSSPDLVFFVNHDDALLQMQQITEQQAKNKRVWFHAGEFSDSLALSHITGELPLYWQFFTQNPNAYLELRTKSINLTVLRSLPPRDNIVVSFSLSPHEQAALYDRAAPSVEQRLSAMQRLRDRGFLLGVHFDPIIYAENFAEAFTAVVRALCERIGFANIAYISVGVVRFAKDVFRAARQNYHDSPLFARHFIQGMDNKMRYIRPLRLYLIEQATGILKKHGCPEEKMYICME